MKMSVEVLNIKKKVLYVVICEAHTHKWLPQIHCLQTVQSLRKRKKRDTFKDPVSCSN